MEYGVYTSDTLEIAQTRFWTLCLYCNADKSIIGAKLYNGVDDSKTLAAICERSIMANKTAYAYEKPDGQRFTNDFEGVCKLIGSEYHFDSKTLRKIDDIVISEPYKMPTVSEAGIEKCLRQWRMGDSLWVNDNGLEFKMVTNKIEYIFSIYDNNCNIYCGASVNIPYSGGMFGSGQYFRIRNYKDNSTPNCRFSCNIGGDAVVRKVPEIVCESGKCTSTSDGLYWPVKRFSDNKIVLDGCGGDEYIYRSNLYKSEYFKVL